MKTARHRTCSIALALGAVCSGFALGAQTKIGDPVPQFTLTSMGGKEMFFKDMQTGGPIFLFFIRDGDSVTQQATYYINQIIKDYGTSRATWYGIINANKDRARSYQAEVNPPFQLERDENTSAVKIFGVTNPPVIFEYSRRGKLMNVWKGYSEANLISLNTEMARVSRKPLQSIDFSKAPQSIQFGVDYAGTGTRIGGG